MGKIKQEEMQPATAESMVSSECPVNSNHHSVALWAFQIGLSHIGSKGLAAPPPRSFHGFSKRASESKAKMPDVSIGHRAQKLIPC